MDYDFAKMVREYPDTFRPKTDWAIKNRGRSVVDMQTGENPIRIRLARYGDVAGYILGDRGELIKI